MNPTRTSVLGVGVSAVNVPTATAAIARWLDHREKQYVTVTGVHGVIESQDDPAFRSILNASGLTVPDGMPLVWLSKRAGLRHVTQVTGLDLMHSVSAMLAERGGSAFYYGANPGVAEQAANLLVAKYGGLRTAGVYCPPFRPLTPAEALEVAALINSSSPDVVWVGLSTPKLERWMARMRAQLDAPVLIGVGAAFDFLTGRIRRPPVIVRELGLEWLYRLVQDPRRLGQRYLRNNPRFLYFLACERLGLRTFNA